MPTGCTCRKIVVDAKNVVRDAEVESGDAKVINTSITYITPTYGDNEVDIDQEAEARSGDAIAGQIIAVDGGDNGCASIHVTATNIVEDTEVTSGDAIARNVSVVLLDPSIDRGELDIDVDQEAEAESGLALAGQVLGVRGGGGPCGGVILDALNKVKNVEVETGDSVAENISEILACADAGCLREVRGVLEGAESVDVCDETGCHPVATNRFVKMLKESFEKDSIDADEESEEAPLDEHRRRRRRGSRTPEPEEVPAQTAPEVTPTPSPTASPSGVV